MSEYSLKELLEMARDIEPSKALSQQLVMLAHDAGKRSALKKGIRINVVLNAKKQVSYVTNYDANATIIMDDDI
ncbi:MAG: hypothetical protein WC790_02980 [Candidatus Paceibacterota bacterium]|jgi:hypothetical protein